jgi:autotransporter adhesin
MNVDTNNEICPKLPNTHEEDSADVSLKSSKSNQDVVKLKKKTMVKSKSASRVSKRVTTTTAHRKQSQRKLKQQLESATKNEEIEVKLNENEAQSTHLRTKVDDILTNYKCSNRIEYLKSSSTPVIRRGPLKVPKGVTGLDLSNIS